MSDERHDLQMTLPDGRQLGYAEYGDPAGTPVFYFHGFPGSRYEARPLAKAAARQKIRLVALDRPGMGLSEFLPRRKMVDWPVDVAAAAQTLGWKHFAVIGMSGGGPYALSCARTLSGSVTHCVLMAGVAPLNKRGATREMMPINRILFATARIFPFLMRPAFNFVQRTIMERPENYLESTANVMPPADKRLFTDPKLQEQILPIVREPFRRGVQGATYEGRLYVRGWGFEFAEIKTPVTIWQGKEDVNVPPNMARLQHQQLPASQLHLLDNEGHLSLLFNQGDNILEVPFGAHHFTMCSVLVHASQTTSTGALNTFSIVKVLFAKSLIFIVFCLNFIYIIFESINSIFP